MLYSTRKGEHVQWGHTKLKKKQGRNAGVSRLLSTTIVHSQYPVRPNSLLAK